jgi:hypothetical protein
VILKGATLDVLSWGRVGLKRAWDIDILVAPTDAVRARRVLESEGYGLSDPHAPSDATFDLWIRLSKECALVHRETGLVVELHWRASDAATLASGVSAGCPTQTVTLNGLMTLRTLAADHLFTYLCVHGASHGWSRLKWLADLSALLARCDETERVRLYRRAEDLGAGNCPALAMIICERLFDAPPPAVLREHILANAKARRLAALAVEVMTHRGAAEGGRPPFADRILLSHFLFADGWRYRWAEFRRQSVSIDDHMRLRLPAWLTFAYAPLRGPLWLWRRLRRP